MDLIDEKHNFRETIPFIFVHIRHAMLRSLIGLITFRKNSLDSGTQMFSRGANARTMANFAAAMMRKLAEIDYEKFTLDNVPDLKLRWDTKTNN